MHLFLKLAALIVALTATAAILLGLRQTRIRLAHELVIEHRRVDGSRRDIWDLQQRIAARTHPGKLREDIEAAGLELEPVRPIAPADTGSALPASSQSSRRELRP